MRLIIYDPDNHILNAYFTYQLKFERTDMQANKTSKTRGPVRQKILPGILVFLVNNFILVEII